MSRTSMLSARRPLYTDSYVGSTLLDSLQHYEHRFAPNDTAKEAIMHYIIYSDFELLEYCSVLLGHFILRFYITLPYNTLWLICRLPRELGVIMFGALYITDPLQYADFLSQYSAEDFAVTIAPIQVLYPFQDILCAQARFAQCWEAISAKLLALKEYVQPELLLRLPFLPFDAYFEVLAEQIMLCSEQPARSSILGVYNVASALADTIEIDSLIEQHTRNALRLFVCGALFSQLNSQKYTQRRCAKWIRRCFNSIDADVRSAAEEAILELASTKSQLICEIGAKTVAQCLRSDEILYLCPEAFYAEVLDIRYLYMCY